MNGPGLKSLRSRLGLTQAALAEAVGVVPNTLARWERGDLGVPSWAVERLDAVSRSGSSGSAVTRPRRIVLDPHYQEIIKALNGRLDPTAFEECAVDLLKRDWPGLVLVAGGGDEGFDGAVADGAKRAPFPLVVTTATDYSGNLRRNLRRAQRRRTTVDRALFATSQRVTPRMRQKLEAEAGKLNVTLLQIYDQDWFASCLYGRPGWCKRLLRVTGRPRALSPFPVTQRPVLGDRVLGRERETRWLQERSGDCLLVGAPGSGKTFLLRALVLQGQALFLVADDREQLANDLRSLKPAAVIIDDAHVDSRQLERFAQLRTEVGSDARIIATSWPGSAVAVQDALRVPNSEVLDLDRDLIDADTMIEIIKSTGITGPNDLLRIIRIQAAGRPGLAATLSHMCLAGDIRRAASGEGLVDRLAPQLDRMLEEEDSTRLLAPFALGGDAGVHLEPVAEQLRRPLDYVSRCLSRLAAAGIVMEHPNRAVSVEPAPMRWVLVRRFFFAGAGSPDVTPFLNIAEDQDDAVHTLIGARARGAAVPDLEERLERADSDRLWFDYASLGPAEARYVIDRHPGRLLEIAQHALEQAPEKAIPLLLDGVSTSGEPRPRDLLSRDPLDALAEWATHLSPAREDWYHRRSTLLHMADRWRRRGGNAGTALRAMCIALHPKSEYTTTDPGRGRTVTLHFGTLDCRHVEELRTLWTSCVEVLRELGGSDAPWRDLLRLVSDWVHYPFDRLLRISDEARTEIANFTSRMIQDLADVSRRHPGLQHELGEAGKRAGLNVDVTLDPEFEALHECLEPDEEIEMMTSGPPGSVVATWEGRSVEEMVRSFARIESEESIAGIQYPRWSPYLCARLAERVPDVVAAAEKFMERGLPADLIEPFVLRAAKTNHQRWPAIVLRCLDSDSLRALGIQAAVTHVAPPRELLSTALKAAGDFEQHIYAWCLRGEVPPTTLLQMFSSADARIAVSAAIGHWCRCAVRRAGNGSGTSCASCGSEVAVEEAVCPMCWRILNLQAYKKAAFDDGARKEGRGLYRAWRDAILRAPAEGVQAPQRDEYWFGKILSRDCRLAEEWLLTTFARGDDGGSRVPWTWQEAAVQALEAGQRTTVLAALHSSSCTDRLVECLVDNDVEIYRKLLETDELEEHHLAPLARTPCKQWRLKALVALSRGYSVDDIVSASVDDQHWSWSGPMHEVWAEWRTAFEGLCDDADPRIVRIGEQGAEILRKREQQELQLQRYEDVRGLG